MKYFKNTELARLYNISEKSVRNWIHAASEGKLDMQLYDNNGKLHVANTTKNTLLIEELVNKGRKYKNGRGFKVVRPDQEFYEMYSASQIYDMISSIDIHREIPYQYNYFDGWAEHWDAYVAELMKENAPNSATSTVELLNINTPYLDALLEGYESVNIIDVGVGNVMPVKGLLEHFLEKGQLKRYIGIDISNDMLAIADRNVKAWFGDKIRFEGFVKDVNYDRFNDLLTPESFGDNATKTRNIILFLGGTISNLRQPNHALTTIHDSMSKHDLLIFAKKLDTSSTRRYFDLTLEAQKKNDEALDFPGIMLVRLLGLDRSLFTVEQFFNEELRERQTCIRLNVAISIAFDVEGQQTNIELNKGERLLTWRAQHQNALEIIEQFNDNEFDLLQVTKSRDQGHLLSISRIKTNEQVAS